MYDLYIEYLIDEKQEDKFQEWKGDEKKKGIIKDINAVNCSTYRRIFLNSFILKLKSLKRHL